MFINIQNKVGLDGYGVDIVNLENSELTDDARLKEYSQLEFINKKISPEGREKLLNDYKNYKNKGKDLSLEEIAEVWETKIPMTGKRIIFEFDPESIYDPVPELGIHSARKCVEQSGFEVVDIDLIIGATNTNRGYPSLADGIKKRLWTDGGKIAGKSQAHCYDVKEACTAGSVAVNDAWQYLRNGSALVALINSTEIASILTNFDDYRGSNLFKDSSSSMLCRRLIGKESFIFFHNESYSYDGNDELVYRTKDNCFFQNGPKVHEFVADTVLKELDKSIKKAGIDPATIDSFIPHQPSGKTLKFMKEQLLKMWPGFKHEAFRINPEAGNDSAASTLGLISKLIKDGTIKRGHKVVVSTFGSGLSIGSYGFIY